jgi:hypothetical protein
MPDPETHTELPALGRSVDDAEVLVGYAIRNNVQGVQDAIEGIAAAREFYQAGTLRGEEQKKFYENFSQLAARVAPVTVATLKSCLDEYGPGRKTWLGLGQSVPCSYAERAARRYRLLATFALISLLLVQSYWLVGSNLLAAMPKMTAAEAGALETDFIRERNEPAANPEKSATTENKTDDSKAIGATKSVFYRRTAIKDMLNTWMSCIPRLSGNSAPGFSPNEADMNIERVVALASRVLEVLQQYVLPLLYGWLGSMAYVLRTLGQQARARLYSMEDQIGYGLRTWLGIVSGLAIGWFFRSDKGDTVATVGSISGLSLAFVAGYSVDLLFTAMDRIVAAFSSAPETARPPQRQDESPKPAISKTK